MEYLIRIFKSSSSYELVLQAQPANLATSFKQRAMLVDEIWHAAGGDTSDIDWYVNRTILGGIYSATEIYMLTDSSPGALSQVPRLWVWICLNSNLFPFASSSLLDGLLEVFVRMTWPIYGGINADWPDPKKWMKTKLMLTLHSTITLGTSLPLRNKWSPNAIFIPIEGVLFLIFWFLIYIYI